MRDAELKAKIEAYNRAGEIANELYSQFIEIFKPLVGQKVCKADGSLMKKVQDLLPKSNFPDKWPHPTAIYYRENSEHSLSFIVKTCAVDGKGSCVYERITVCICDLSSGVIQDRWYDPPNCRTDYTLEEVQALHRDYEIKKRAAEHALRKCGHFRPDWF